MGPTAALIHMAYAPCWHPVWSWCWRTRDDPRSFDCAPFSSPSDCALGLDFAARASFECPEPRRRRRSSPGPCPPVTLREAEIVAPGRSWGPVLSPKAPEFGPFGRESRVSGPFPDRRRERAWVGAPRGAVRRVASAGGGSPPSALCGRRGERLGRPPATRVLRVLA